MDIKQLEVFIRVAELGSFSKAAKVLDMSQSTLTRMVRRLEADVGRHLLHRNGRGAIATESGKRFLAHSLGVVRHWEIARQEVNDDAASPVGQVVVGLPPRMGSLLTAKIVIEFRRLLPRATIRITEAPTASLHEWILLGRVDVGLLSNPPPSAQLHFELIGTEDLYLVGMTQQACGLPKEVKVRDLGGYPLIIPSRPHVIRLLVEHACNQRNVKLNIALEVDAIDGILELIQKGYGFGILTPLTAPQGGAYQTARITLPRISNQLGIGTAARRPVSNLVRRTSDIIRQEAKKVLSASNG